MNNETDEWKDELKQAFTTTDNFKKEIKSLMNIAICEFFGDKIGRMYKILDNESFSLLIEEFGGLSVDFPSKEEFRESVMSIIIYYYKNVMNYSWEKIEKMIPYERDIGLRYDRKIRKISNGLKKRIKNMSKEEIEKSIFEI